LVDHIEEKSRLTMSDNRMLRKIFGARMDEVTREWRKIHNEGLE